MRDSSENKTLFAGPWVGEFGWELCSWNPIVRHEAQKYDKVIVEIQPGMEYLYEFADEIRINPRVGDYDMYQGKASKSSDVPPGVVHVHPAKLWKTWGQKEFREIKKGKGVLDSSNIHPKKWRKLGTENPKYVADILCAFRGPKIFRGKLSPEKHWEVIYCEELVARLKAEGLSVALYGGLDNVYCRGAEDLRGLPLKDISGILAQSKLAVGPSSGTLHLASLCGTPHIFWYGKPITSLDRYARCWNPFSTPNTFINKPNPSVDTVMEYILEKLKNE